MLQNCNGARFVPGQRQGHYESFFLRANHPSRPLAFWIRYTVFSPHGRPADAIGELWAVISNGESGTQVAVKKELPILACRFAQDRLSVGIGDASLEDGSLRGAAQSGGHRVEWDLHYHGEAVPVLLLPEKLYETRLPKAKSLVSLPMASFGGRIKVDGEPLEIRDWKGSQNHNWGSRHTDRYAYGQVCGFDNAPESFLEIATAKVKLGPVWTPAMTPIVLRHAGKELAMNTIRQSLRARASYRYFEWQFRSENADTVIDGEVVGKRENFVGLRYYNPPGGQKWCLNSKLADCRLSLIDKRSGAREELTARHRAAFEILTDDTHHGVEISA